MTPEQLETIGCKIIHWNPKLNGGFFEHYLPITGSGLGVYDSRLCVVFGGHNSQKLNVDFVAQIKLRQSCVILEHVTTIEQFKTMYELLTGNKATED